MRSRNIYIQNCCSLLPHVKLLKAIYLVVRTKEKAVNASDLLSRAFDRIRYRCFSYQDVK
jgi:ornithine carbamoyltransferase